MKIISIILIVLSVFVAVYGMLHSISAPQDCSYFAIAIYIAILARIAQASSHTKKLLKKVL